MKIWENYQLDRINRLEPSAFFDISNEGKGVTKSK